MAKRRTVGTANGRRSQVKSAVNAGRISQSGIRRELAAQRRAFGAAGQARAMRNWGLTERKATKRGGKATIAGKRG